MNIDELLSQFDTTSEAINTISKTLDVSKGAVGRWITKGVIPKAYTFDLMKLLHLPIDYTHYTFTEKDQFFTPDTTARECYDTFCNVVTELGCSETLFHYVEPSAGSGSFLNVLPSNRTIGMDIEPHDSRVQQQDYLQWTPSTSSTPIVVFGNPPFGLRGNLALRFINHSSSFADFVCFILPQLFESDGKGVPRARVKGYNLLYSKKISSVFHSPNENEIHVHTVFQIWSKYYTNETYSNKSHTTANELLKVYSLSDGGTPSSTRNKKMLNECDMYIPSTCFGEKNMRWYTTFEELPCRRGYGIVFNNEKERFIRIGKKIDWTQVAFKSTNSALNIRSSQIMKVFSEYVV